MLKLWYCDKSKEVYRDMRRDKREFTIALVWKAYAPQVTMVTESYTASWTDFLVVVNLSRFRDFNDRFLINSNVQLNRW